MHCRAFRLYSSPRKLGSLYYLRDLDHRGSQEAAPRATEGTAPQRVETPVLTNNKGGMYFCREVADDSDTVQHSWLGHSGMLPES